MRGAPAAVRPLCVLLAVAAPQGEALGDALHDHDNGPLTGIFGFQDSTEAGRLVPRDASEWDLTTITSSHSTEDRPAGESLLLDGETTRLELVVRYGLTDRLELGIELPYVWHESGGLDAVIEGWHDLFGLPNGSRDKRERDLLEFRYDAGDSTPVVLQNSSNGPGDVRLIAGWRLADSPTSATALRLGLKLPTGDSERLLGSGGTDVSLGIASDRRALWDVAGLSGFYGLSVSYLGDTGLPFDSHRHLVGRMSAGIGWFAFERLELRAQTTLRSAVYDSETDALGRAAAMLTFGAHIHLAPRMRLTLAVAEDIRVGSAPDVSFQLALRYRPD